MEDLLRECAFEFKFSECQFSFLCLNRGRPAMYDVYKEQAQLTDEFDDSEPNENRFFLAVSKDSGPPIINIIQKMPSRSFKPSALLVASTKTLFVGAGTRMLCYSLEPPKRLSVRKVEYGVLSLSAHSDYVLMSAEIELACWNSHGQQVWTCYVEPPWDYSVQNGLVYLRSENMKLSFEIERGPVNT